MAKKYIHPIQDEDLAEKAIDLFLHGYDPYLIAGALGLTPEIVMAQIRVTLQIHVDKALRRD